MMSAERLTEIRSGVDRWSDWQPDVGELRKATRELLDHITHQQQEIERLTKDATYFTDLAHKYEAAMESKNDRIAALTSQLATLREELECAIRDEDGDCRACRWVGHSPDCRVGKLLAAATPTSPSSARVETEVPAGVECDCGHLAKDHDFGEDDCDQCSCTHVVPYDAARGGE